MLKIFNMFKSMNQKQKLLVKAILTFFAICIILVIVVGLIKNRKHSYSEIEEKLVSAAKSYYEDNEKLLPGKDGGTVSVDSLTLIEKEYMKEFTKYNKQAESCSATVTVTNNGGKYLYIASLKCVDYQTESLYEKILKNEKIVTEGTGLYAMDNDYIYRGEYPDNYVEFAGKRWRILRLTSGKEIRLIQEDYYQASPWDNRYNVNSKYNSGITSFEVSRIKDKLAKIYETDFDDTDKSYIVSKQLCIGKRGKKETDNSGKIECSTLTENTYPLGLIQANEYVIVSTDKNCSLQSNAACTNYNYLTKLENEFWTITPFNENDYEVYYIQNPVRRDTASDFKAVRLTLNIDGNITYQSGNGTKEDPYVISKK